VPVGGGVDGADGLDELPHAGLIRKQLAAIATAIRDFRLITSPPADESSR
jgi:hypothetical protein